MLYPLSYRGSPASGRSYDRREPVSHPRHPLPQAVERSELSGIRPACPSTTALPTSLIGPRDTRGWRACQFRGGNARLLRAVKRLRDSVDASSLPIDLPQVEEVRTARSRLLDQLDDYVIPRLTSLDAPLLAVVGGSTGAGKSTLVNSIVGREVSLPGVLRPTTRSPVLVHHPDDARWFADQRILPGLARITGKHSSSDGPGAVRLVSTEAIQSGLALLDAPDIDSVVSANRDLAAQLLAAADLWVFVTTAARYADAVPWDLLRQASERGTSVAVVLDRVPAASLDEIRVHLAAMLREQQLEQAPIFTVLESDLEGGLLPAPQTQRLRDWLGLSRETPRPGPRSSATPSPGPWHHSTRGRRRWPPPRLPRSTRPRSSSKPLEWPTRTRWPTSRRECTTGPLLRGEVLARWQEFVGTGEFFRQVESTVSRVRDRVTAFIKGEPAKAGAPRRGAPDRSGGPHLQPGRPGRDGHRSDLAVAARRAASPCRHDRPDALERRPGHADPATREGLAGRHPRDGAQRGARSTDERPNHGLRRQRPRRRPHARHLCLDGWDHRGGGRDSRRHGGRRPEAAPEAVFGDRAVRELARQARVKLLDRVAELYAAERARYEAAVETLEVRTDQAKELKKAVAQVRSAR